MGTRRICMVVFIGLISLIGVIAYDAERVSVLYDAILVPVMSSVAVDAGREASCFMNTTNSTMQCIEGFESIGHISVIEWVLLPPDRIISVLLDQVSFDGEAFYISGDSLSVWSIPIGDRDFSLFPSCRDYEVEKGVCRVEVLP